VRPVFVFAPDFGLGATLSVVEGSGVGAGADYFSFAYSACA
jgi:hypothetical protein